MPFISKRPKLKLSTQEIEQLERIRNSPTESHSRVKRSKIMLLYYADETVSSIARQLNTNRPKDLEVIQKFIPVNESTVILELFDVDDELIIAEIKLDQSGQNIQIHRQPLSSSHEIRFLLTSEFSAPTEEYLKKL